MVCVNWKTWNYIGVNCYNLYRLPSSPIIYCTKKDCQFYDNPILINAYIIYEWSPSILAPCCNRAWFHHKCVQTMALNHGDHHFKSRLCTNLQFCSKILANWCIAGVCNDGLHGLALLSAHICHETKLRCIRVSKCKGTIHMFPQCVI